MLPRSRASSHAWPELLPATLEHNDGEKMTIRYLVHASTPPLSSEAVGNWWERRVSGSLGRSCWKQ